MMHEEIDFSKIIAVSNRHLSRLPYLEQVERICCFHPKAFLLREKDLPPEDYLKLTGEVKAICERHKVLLIPHFIRRRLKPPDPASCICRCGS